MIVAVFAHCFRRGWKSLLWWSVGLAILIAFMIVFYPSVKGSEVDLAGYLDRMPDALKALFLGENANYASAVGYLQGELFNFMLPIAFAVFAISAGSRAIPTDERRGTLDVLLSTPVSRRAILLGPAVNMLAGIIVLAAITFVTLQFGGPAAQMQVPAGQLAAASVSCALLGLAVGTIALLVGAATGRHGRAVGAATAVAIAAYLVNSLSAVVRGLRPFRFASVFYYYAGGSPLRNGLDPAHAVTLALISVLAVVLAVVAFDRRDIVTG